MRILAIFLGLLLLSGCNESGAEYAERENGDENISDYSEEEKGKETFSEFNERRDSYQGSRGSFAGDGCTEDCSGHEAGYDWAADKGIDDPDDCGGTSWSFEEGCRAYAEENAE